MLLPGRGLVGAVERVLALVREHAAAVQERAWLAQQHSGGGSLPEMRLRADGRVGEVEAEAGGVPLRPFSPAQVEGMLRGALQSHLTASSSSKGKGFQLLHAQCILRGEQWVRVSEVLAAARAYQPSPEDGGVPRLFTPCAAFHATRDPQALESILNGSLLAAGDWNAQSGQVLGVAHGSSLGPGVYLSPSLEFADHYAFRDASDRRQVLYCLVVPGRCEELAVHRVHSPEEVPLRLVAGYSARLSADRCQLVAAYSEQVLPVLLATYQPARPENQKVSKQYCRARSPFKFRKKASQNPFTLFSSPPAPLAAGPASDPAVPAFRSLALAVEEAAGTALGRSEGGEGGGAGGAGGGRAGGGAGGGGGQREGGEKRGQDASAASSSSSSSSGAAPGGGAGGLRIGVSEHLTPLCVGDTSGSYSLTVLGGSLPGAVTVTFSGGEELAFTPPSVTVETGQERKGAAFRVTALKACAWATAGAGAAAQANVYYRLSGKGAAAFDPPKPSRIQVVQALWRVPLAPLLSYAPSRLAPASLRLLLLVDVPPPPSSKSAPTNTNNTDGGGAGARKEVWEAVRYVVREVQPTEAALVSVQGAAAAAAGSPAAAWQSSGKLVEVMPRGDEEGGGGDKGDLEEAVSRAVNMVLDKQEATRAARKDQREKEAARELWGVIGLGWSKDQEVAAMCRGWVQQVVDKAMRLGELRREGRQKEFERAVQRREKQEGASEVFVLVALLRASQAGPSDRLRELGEEMGKRLRGAGVRLVVKGMVMGQSAGRGGVQCAAELTRLATEPDWRDPVTMILSRKQLAPACRNVCLEVIGGQVGGGVCVSVPPEERELHSGFVTDWTRPPQWHVTLRPGEEGSVLFQGKPPRCLEVDGSEVGMELDPADLGEQLRRRGGEARREVLAMLQGLTSSLKAAAVAGRPVDPEVQAMRRLVRGIKALAPTSLHRKGAEARVKGSGGRMSLGEWTAEVKERARLTADLERTLNDLTLATQLANVKGAEQAGWMRRVQDEKFAFKAVKRAGGIGGHLSVRRTFLQLRRLEEVVEEGEKEWRGLHSKLTARECIAEMLHQVRAERGGLDWASGVGELLYCFGMVGLQLRVRRSHAATVSPWNIMVEFVSRSISDTAAAMVALDCQAPLKDATGELAPDVLVLLPPEASGASGEDCPWPGTAKGCRSWAGLDVHKSYLSVVFARTPLLPVPQQHLALCGVALVKAAEQLLRRRQGGVVAQTAPRLTREASQFRLPEAQEDVLHMLLMMDTWASLARGPQWAALAEKLAAEGGERHLTEAQGDGVESVCMALCTLACLPQCATLLDGGEGGGEERLGRLALGMMAEAVSRACRVLVKGHEEAMWRLIRRCLSVPDSVEMTPDQPDTFDLETAQRRSGAFFLKTLTNCSPFAVVAMVGVARVTRSFLRERRLSLSAALSRAADRSDLVTAVSTALDEQRISMKAFIKQYVGGASAGVVQVGLYVQGLRYHTSKLRAGREELPPVSDDAAIREIAHQARLQLYADEKAAAQHALARLGKEAQRLARAAALAGEKTHFMKTHSGAPRVFSHAEVAELNAKRPADDQLELIGFAGLLEHHCCFPNCPLFLKDLRPPDTLAKSRRHLYHHLKYFFTPHYDYLRALHARAATVLRGSAITRQSEQAFLSKMEETFSCDSSPDYDAKYWRELLKEVRLSILRVL